MSDDLTAWLRKQIVARRDIAVAALHGSDGHWWRRPHDETGEPTGDLWDGAQIVDSDGDVVGGREVVVYDEGRPSDAQFDHIAGNDPRDVIARCEAELALLNEHAVIRMPYQDARGVPGHFCECATCGFGGPDRSYPCKTVRLLGYGYRHWSGYRESEWKP